MNKKRIDYYLTNFFNISRSKTNDYIKNNEIKINGKKINQKDEKIDIDKDEIVINNKLIKIKEYVYFAFYKPVGFVSANKDKNEKIIFDLIPNSIPYKKNLSIIGRLDKDAHGLILLSNDGNFVHQIKNPKNKIPKEYELIFNRLITKEDIKKILKIKTIDKKEILGFELSNINNNKLNITLYEGKHHHLKKLFYNTRLEIISLKRIRISNVFLKKLNLREGEIIEMDKINI